MTANDSPIEYAVAQRDRFVAELTELLRIPSISTLPEHASDMQRAAEWLCAKLGRIGLRSEVIQTSGHPLVYAEWLQSDGPTVLVYGHYDVQPADPLDLWTTPPFEPAVRNGNLYARGASDDKGQTMTMVNAAECLLAATGSLPVNLKFLLEGEEETGGEAVTAYVRGEGQRLAADIALIADTGMFAPGIPMIETGLRGTVYTEIHARGAAQDLHSGLYGGVAPNPLNALAHIIAGLKGIDGRITIPGFYNRVRPLSDELRRSWQALPFDEETMRRDEIGSPALAGEHDFTPLERMWARPTLDVHGITGGFTGAGAKTVIPAEASAKVSMRLVADQKATEIFELFQACVHALAPPGIEVRVQCFSAADPVLVPEDNAYLRTMAWALEETFGRDAVFGRSGGSIPIVGLLKEALGIDTVLAGWGLPDDNLHAPNEKLSLDNFYHGIEATIRFWQAR